MAYGSNKSYKAIIKVNMNQWGNETLPANEDPTKYLLFDIVNDKKVTSSSTTCSYPLQDGDTMTDHMFRNPDTLNLSGSFSLNGKNWNSDSYGFEGNGDRLTRIQNVFEKIKSQGYLCDVLTLESDSENNINTENARFKSRKNMALISCSWVEKQNSMSFAFEFKEVIMVETQTIQPLNESERIDNGLPSIEEPIGSSLGTVLAKTGQLKEIVIKSLNENGYIDNDFVAHIKMYFNDFALPGGVTAFVAALLIKIVLKVNAITTTLLATAASTTGATIAASSVVAPVGTIVAITIIGAVILIAGISKYIAAIKQRERQKIAFKLVNGSTNPDLNRLTNFLDDIEVEVNKVNSNLSIYTINQDQPHKVNLNIGGNYYIIKFERNNINNNEWNATVETLDGQEIQMQNKWSPISNMVDFDRNQNMWFKDLSKQYEVYLCNASFNDEYNNTQEKIDTVKNKLSSYSIWVSKGRIQDNIKKITDAINKAIISEGFV